MTVPSTSFFILGLPVTTQYGSCRFLTIEDYVTAFIPMSILSFDKITLIHQYKKMYALSKEQLQKIQDFSFLETILISPEVVQMYNQLITLLFDEIHSIHDMNPADFEDIRSLLLKMNCISEIKTNPNPEIQKWIDKDNEYKLKNNGSITLDDMITCVSVYKKIPYTQMREVTLYQLYSDFTQIGNFFNYNTYTLFSTVSIEKLSIPSWCEHIDLFQKKEVGVAKEKYDKIKTEIFS